uniref:S-adenosyl-L-methionine-dependent methyltransferase n=1 Tax=Chlamydomonas leiostraca TaxID=1034604 RepID=A0A7S0WRI5_9CHLO|mmetsp:Transcript_25105/g.63653  ORF Transcript_25105/g.63653 Transcript_25105/m.63653 type:complete len:408 (+) Transcript_25105:46-1269(+)
MQCHMQHMRSCSRHAAQGWAASRITVGQCWAKQARGRALQHLSVHAAAPSAHSLTDDTHISPSAIDISLRIARARLAETEAASQQSIQPLFIDPYAEALVKGSQPSSSTSTATLLMDALATRYLDELLLTALAATNVNTINKGDYRQVVLVGDGFDTRPYRLPWPEGTIIFLVAPAESHQAAEAVIKAAGAHVPRSCLLRRVNAPLQQETTSAGSNGSTSTANTAGASNAAGSSGDSGQQEEQDPFVSFMTNLERAGFQGSKLSVWVLQGVPYCVGMAGHQPDAASHQHTRSMVRSLLAEIGNAAAFNSLVMGELPQLTRRDAENLLAEAGLLAAVVDFNTEAAAAGRLVVQEGPAPGHGGEELASQRVRRLFTSQQLRLSLVEMGVYEEFRSEAEGLDEDFTGNFS